jgi:dTDP-4-dehydrorhamnose 3,5-epimerase
LGKGNNIIKNIPTFVGLNQNISMFVKESKIKGVFISEPIVYKDHRGSFMESFRYDVWGPYIGAVRFIQENESYSTQNVLRGLHYQILPYGQSKLVRAVWGTVMDVVVDMRPESPTFGCYHVEILDNIKKRQIFIPDRFAHGFLVLSPEAVVQYKVDAPYHPESERTLKFDDPFLSIDWGVPSDSCVVSGKDRSGLFWDEAIRQIYMI